MEDKTNEVLEMLQDINTEGLHKIVEYANKEIQLKNSVGG